MFVYYGKRYNSASIGRRLVEVVCDRCLCPYFYELARFGSGAASSHYGIGTAGAARSAENQAVQELGRRLEKEAELVPCPKCLWISDRLVQGYRQGRCRGWGQTAAIIGIGGSLLTLGLGWLMSSGPGADHAATRYVLIGGPAVSIGLAALILLVRWMLRSLISPNRKHPFPPKLPPGSPNALLRDPVTGNFRPFVPVLGRDEAERSWVDFQVGRSNLPEVCCVCLDASARRLAIKRTLFTAVVLSVPICPACAHRWKWQSRQAVWIMLAMTAAIGLPALAASKIDGPQYWVAVSGLGLFAWIVGGMIANHRANPVRVKVVDVGRGVVRLRFQNVKYPDLFEKQKRGPSGFCHEKINVPLVSPGVLLASSK